MPSALLPTVKLVSAKQVPVFRLGKQTDSSGIEKVWTPKEVDEAIAAYNEVAAKSDHEAPVLHGHRGKHAFGWIEKAYRVGETVFCDLKNVVESFAQNVNGKLHPKRSISFYPPSHPNNPTPGRLNINHLAYLPAEGEVNPAVKGLPDHTFSDAELDACIEYEFSDYNFGAWMGGSPLDAVANLFQSLRDKTIEDEDLETADRLFPPGAIDAIKAAASQPWASIDLVLDMLRPLQQQVDRLTYPVDATPSSAYTDTTTTEVMSETQETDNQVSQTDFAELQNTVKELTAKLAITEAQASNLEKENQRLGAERENDRIASFVEKLVSDRKLRATEKDAVIQELKWLPNDNPVEFSEGGATVSKTPRQAKMDRLAAATELYSVRHMPTGPEHDPTSFTEQQSINGLDNVDPDSIRQDQMIRAKQKELAAQTGQPVEYAEAMNALIKTGAISF